MREKVIKFISPKINLKRGVFLFLSCILLLFTLETSFTQEAIYHPDKDPHLPSETPELSSGGQKTVPTQERPQEKPPEKEDKQKNMTAARIEESEVYLDFREADIRDVARIFSKLSGVSILVSEEVRAKVTLNIEGVPWKEALDIILKTYNLGYIEKNGFLIIVSYKKLQEIQEQVPLITKIVPLNFVTIDEAKVYIKSMLTKRGNLEGDKKTNSLIITDTAEKIEAIEKVLKELDRKTPQVLVEAWIIDKTLTNDWDFGIDWNLIDRDTPEEIGFSSSIGQNLANPSATNLILQYGDVVLGNSSKFIGVLQMLKDEGNAKILANPRLLTLDNIQAQIEITNQVPYTKAEETTEGEPKVTTDFKDTGITLNVKPHITSDGHILLEIMVEQKFQSGTVVDQYGPQPIIASRKSSNTMLVRDGQTIVIGGLRARENTESIKKVPLLGDLPLLGKLFKSTSTSDSVRELLIFVTPFIVKPETFVSEKEKAQLEETKASLETREKKKEIKLERGESNQTTTSKVDLKLKPVREEKIKEPIPPNFGTFKILPLKAPDENY